MAVDAAVAARAFEPGDHAWADGLIAAHQGSRMTARLGELLDPLTLPGWVAMRGGRRLGLLTYQVIGDELEVITLHAEVSRLGAGSALLARALAEARARSCRRLWLVTTNDNTGAIAFYLRRGMQLARIHRDAVSEDRLVKPEISLVNADNGMPITDLLEFELTP